MCVRNGGVLGSTFPFSPAPLAPGCVDREVLEDYNVSDNANKSSNINDTITNSTITCP